MHISSQPMTQQGRVPPPPTPSQRLLPQCLTLPSGTEVLLPFQELPFPFWDLTPSPPPPSSLLSCVWFQAKEEPLPLISLQPIITRYLGAALDVGHVLPFPTWSPTLLSSSGALPTVPTLVICAFLLSSLYTTYTHCGLGGAPFQHVSGSPPPVSVSLLMFIQKQLHWGFS